LILGILKETVTARNSSGRGGFALRRFLSVVTITSVIVISFSPARGQEFSEIDTMSFPWADGYPGDTVVTSINLVNSFDVAGFSFRIVYDASAFEILSVETASRSIQFELFGADLTEPGVMRFFATSMHPLENAIPPGSGIIAAIAVFVKEEASPGNYDFVFQDVDSSAFDNSLTNIEFNLVVPILSDGVFGVQPTTGIDGNANLPHAFVLDQNYPNPFNGNTVIRFFLERAENIDLEIYDLLGRRVAILFSGTAGAGEHSYTWNGRSDEGDDLASGIYLYRLNALEGTCVTKTMTLVK
jgi:hypothetical protein